MPNLLSRLSIAVAILSMFASPLPGQWRLGVELGAARFWGGSRDTGGENTSFVPYRPTIIGVGLERQLGKYGLGLQLRYTEASLALVGPEVAVATEGAFTTFSVAPEAIVRIATLGAGNEFRVHAGPLFEIWDLIDMDSRTRMGAQGSLSLDIPLGERFRGAVLAGGAVVSSPYNEGDLDLGPDAPTYQRRALWRRNFAVGLSYKL